VFVVSLGHVFAQQAPTARELGIKYMRDSQEYATLSRQVYRLASEAVSRGAQENPGRPWAVVLDVDETALDNSTYQLERAAYGLPYDPASWAAWIERREAGAVPGVVDFIDLVRKAGGRVAWITNREASLTEPTRANLEGVGLWTASDRLCLQKSSQHTKADRRREVVTGEGECAWTGSPARVVVFVGDQMGDFPGPAEQIPQTGSDAAFGRTCFLLPNSMYGGWTTGVTRVRSVR
jgi:5'-nucleotidase (lipoprotein e(P4) family)